MAPSGCDCCQSVAMVGLPDGIGSKARRAIESIARAKRRRCQRFALGEPTATAIRETGNPEWDTFPLGGHRPTVAEAERKRTRQPVPMNLGAGSNTWGE